MAHVRVWKFRPPPERAEEFAAGYASDGAWSRLFRQAEGFVATELYRPTQQGGWWLTIDRWRSRAAYEAFVSSSKSLYAALDRRGDGNEFAGNGNSLDKAKAVGIGYELFSYQLSAISYQLSAISYQLSAKPSSPEAPIDIGRQPFRRAGSAD